MDTIAFRSAPDHLADLRAGRIGARELVDLYLGRIEVEGMSRKHLDLRTRR